MSHAPLVSVIIPTFNRANLLRKAIRSVADQVGDGFEIIISDNCSQDHTCDVVSEFLDDPRVFYSRNDRNLGMVGNWRKAIYELARGEWFILMSDDDYLTDPQYISKAIDAIKRHQPIFVYSGGVVHDVASNSFDTVHLPFEGLVQGERVFAARGTLLPQDAFLPTMVFRIADARRHSFLADPDNLSCDSELYLSLCTEGQVFAIPTPACVYVKHGKNLIHRIKTTRRLLDRNIDHLVNPFAAAIDRGFSPDSLSSFRDHTQLDHSIASTFLRLWLHNECWYQVCRQRVAAKLPQIVEEIESSLSYRTKRLLIALARPVLQSRFPLVDSARAEH